MLDLEGSGAGKPGYSPKYQVSTPAAMQKYDQMAIELVKRYAGARLIVASVFSNTLAYHEAVLDAKLGSWAVDVQDQWATNDPTKYDAIARNYLNAFAAARVRRPVLVDNLASDPGGTPVTAPNMILS